MNMTTNFEDFCDGLMADDHPMERLEPEGFAAEFSAYFQLPACRGLNRLAELFQRTGIGKVSPAKLPGTLRGVHYTLPDGSSMRSTTRRANGRGPVSTRCSTRATRSCTRLYGTAVIMRRRSRKCAPRRTGSRRRR